MHVADNNTVASCIVELFSICTRFSWLDTLSLAYLMNHFACNLDIFFLEEKHVDENVVF